MNWTPYFLEDILQLRDTWLALTIILTVVFLIILLLLIFLRQRICIAIALIQQGSKAVGQMYSTLLFPLIPFLLQLVSTEYDYQNFILLLFLQVVIGWFLLVSLYLTSSGEQEYRVTIPENADCSSHSSCYFTNMSNTRKMYKTSTLCTPHTFSACLKDCPAATCQFVRNVANKNYFWLQMVNIFGLYWGLFFFSAFSEMVLAGVFSKVRSAVFTYF